MIRKIIGLIKNYDKIMEIINKEESKDTKSSKRCSFFNTPQNQIDYIKNHMKGEK